MVRASVEPRLSVTLGTVLVGSSPRFSFALFSEREASRLQEPDA